MPRPWTEEEAAELDRRYTVLCEFRRRFEKVFGEQSDQRAGRLAREIEIDGDIAAIPAAHRLAVGRQVIIALHEADLIDYDRDNADEHWRVVAKRLGLPFLEVYHAVGAERHRGDNTRDDLTDWLTWASVHAPHRLDEWANRVEKQERKRARSRKRRAA